MNKLKSGGYPAWTAHHLTDDQFKRGLEVINDIDNSKPEKQRYLNVFSLRKPYLSIKNE